MRAYRFFGRIVKSRKICCQYKTVPEIKKFYGTVLYSLTGDFMIFFFSGGVVMQMNGEYLETIQDLKRCFCIDELVYSYCNGELEIFLEKIGERKKAEQIRNIPENNALLLIRLYEVFDLNYEDSEEKIRNDYALNP